MANSAGELPTASKRTLGTHIAGYGFGQRSVHEARRPSQGAMANRTHFFAVAARAMRQILVDYARPHRRGKRGGTVVFLPLDEAVAVAPEVSADLLLLDEAL